MFHHFRHLVITILLCLLSAAPLEAVECESMRVIEVGVVVDPSWQSTEQWKTWISERLRYANNLFSDHQAGIQLRWSSEKLMVWNPRSDMRHPSAAMQHVKRYANSFANDIVVAFVDLGDGGEKAGSYPSAASQNFQNVVAINVAAPQEVTYIRDESGELKVHSKRAKSALDHNREFAHEVLHLFGIPHSNSKNSIMLPNANGDELEADQVELLLASKCELKFDVGVDSLSAYTQARINQMFENNDDGESMHPLAAGLLAKAVDKLLSKNAAVAIELLKRALEFEPDDRQITETLDVAYSVEHKQ